MLGACMVCGDMLCCGVCYACAWLCNVLCCQSGVLYVVVWCCSVLVCIMYRYACIVLELVACIVVCYVVGVAVDGAIVYSIVCFNVVFNCIQLVS